MRASIKSVGKNFSTHRMLEEYYTAYYKPAMAAGLALRKDAYASSRSLAAYLEKLYRAWPSVSVNDMSDDAAPVVSRGTKIKVQAKVNLGDLSPEEVLVECYRGPTTSKGEIENPERNQMSCVGREGDYCLYECFTNGRLTGQIGYSVRVLPSHPALADRFVPGLVRWA
jgi:starch phosphorylase